MLNKTIELWWLVLLAVLLCHSWSYAAAVQGSLPAEVSAQGIVVREQPLPIFATFPGRVNSTNEVQVASRLMGYVKKMPVHEGQLVQKGELLLALDASDINAAIAQAQAGVAKAASVLAEATANYQRFTELYQAQAVPQQQFQQVEMGYRVAQGNSAAAQAGLAQAQAQLNYVDVRAPFAGTIVNRYIDLGQLASPGQPLMTIQSAGHFQVEVQVSQRAFEQLRIGMPVAVEIADSNNPAQPVQATVARMVAAADPVSHSHSVKLNLPEECGASSGAFARVKIQVATQTGVLLPAEAIQRRAGLDGVFVVDESGVATFRMVRLGDSGAHGVVVLSGVVAGDRVVVSAAGELNNGVRVQLALGGNL
ncbi:MAG: efflux RND transporter periplasmic adaptor subunit [Desulfuromonas sp.]|nr:efflux RND transporter periplasmic adaptor subunit [Desulfuromonas sp.]